MRKIKCIIKKILGTTNYKYPIYNGFLYENIESSCCGGTLNQEQLYIVTNLQEHELHSLEKLIKHEKICYSIISSFENYQEFENTGEMPYNHIINIFKYIENNSLLDEMSFVYEQLQYEGDYLIDNVKEGSCTTILISDDIVLLDSVASMIKGLGKAFGTHGVICNGVTSNRTMSVMETVPLALYLNCKYGQILTGEVLEMIE